MKMIDTDFVRQKWTYMPEFSTADTSSIADEIQKKLDRIYKEHNTMDDMTYCGKPVVDISPGVNRAYVKFMDNLLYIDRPRELGITHEPMSDGVTLELKCDMVHSQKLYDTHDVRIYNSKPHVEVKPDVEVLHKGFKTPKIKKDGKWFNLTPKKVKFSGPATIILWEDGTKTVVKCQEEDVWSDEVGIVMCYVKKMLGNKGNFNNIFRQAMKVAEVQTKKEELVINKDAKKILEKIPHFDSAYDAVPEDYNFVEGNYEEETK